MNFQKLLNKYYDDMSEQDALNTRRMHGGVLWDFAAWLNRDAELRNEAVQRYGETPVSEQPTSETDAGISEEDEAWQDEIDRQIIRDEDESIRKFRYGKRD